MTERGDEQMFESKSTESSAPKADILKRIAFISIGILIVTGVGLWTKRNIQKFERETIQKTNQYMISLAREKSQSIEKFVQDIQDYLSLLARKPFSGEFKKDQPLLFKDYVAGRALFDHVGGRVDSIYRLDKKGRILDRVPYKDGTIGKDFSDVSGVKFAIETHTPHISGIFQIRPGTQGFSICHPVFEKEKFMGLICVLVSLDTLNRFIHQVEAGATGSSWVITGDGLIISHADPALIGKNIIRVKKEAFPDFDWSEFEALVQQMADGDEGFGIYQSALPFEKGVQAVKKVAVFLPIHLHDQVWSIAITMDYDEIAKPIQKNARNNFLAAGLMMSIFGFMGIIFYKNQKRKAELEAVSRSAEELRISNEKLRLEIEQRIQAEKARQESEDNYRLLAENVTDIIWIADSDLRLTYVSPSVTRVLGYSVEGSIGQSIEKTLPPPSLEVVKEALADELEGEGREQGDTSRSRTLDLELYRKDGSTIWAETKVGFLYGPDGRPTGLLGVSRDITEKMELQQQLFQSQKMESIGTLAGGIAHDFNNLLGGILGYASLMKTKLSRNHQVYGHADTIERSASRAAELTAKLLAFARGEEREARILNLNELIDETLEIIGRTFGKSIEISLNLSESIPTVEADAGQIQQILMNLCLNARDALSDGGKLIIETDVKNLTEEYAESHAGTKPGEYVTLSVTDTGVGIDKETVKRIFEPFFTTKEKGKGTGLGLSVVYGVVKNHGGHVNVHTEPGKGSTFEILLPASGKPEEKIGPEAGLPRGGDELILVVDDEEVIRSLAKDTLESHGYNVLLAKDGVEAIEVYGAHNGQISLAIIDMAMPKLGGRETFLKLKELDPQVRVLLTTGYSHNGEAEKMVENGVLGFVQKPYRLDEFLSMVRSALDMKPKI